MIMLPFKIKHVFLVHKSIPKYMLLCTVKQIQDGKQGQIHFDYKYIGRVDSILRRVDKNVD